MVFCPEHPKRDQNLKFTPLSEATRIPAQPLSYGSPSPPSRAWVTVLEYYHHYKDMYGNSTGKFYRHEVKLFL